MINISPTAIKEIKRIQANATLGKSNFFRLAIKPGGCSGMFYDLQLETEEPQQSDEHHLLEIEGVSLIVDRQSWKYIENLKLDYSEDLIGGGFRFNNPQVKDICGCGISFAGEK